MRMTSCWGIVIVVSSNCARARYLECDRDHCHVAAASRLVEDRGRQPIAAVNFQEPPLHILGEPQTISLTRQTDKRASDLLPCARVSFFFFHWTLRLG